ncbi:hypothetical protein ACM39_02020 [Chryseobacterium sp. FH2]|nr:hypothetical protein ACM39_02020 [Chryseobacterium sp. FH2]
MNCTSVNFYQHTLCFGVKIINISFYKININLYKFQQKHNFDSLNLILNKKNSADKMSAPTKDIY